MNDASSVVAAAEELLRDTEDLHTWLKFRGAPFVLDSRGNKMRAGDACNHGKIAMVGNDGCPHKAQKMLACKSSCPNRTGENKRAWVLKDDNRSNTIDCNWYWASTVYKIYV